MQMTKYKYRMIARITLEATSPLAVGSGEKDIITDAPVARDVNDLPYIPGTSLMGIIRHSLKALKERDSIFGYQKGDKEKAPRSSFPTHCFWAATRRPWTDLRT